MADGISTLASLNWGTATGGAAGSGESTLTLGVDRTDVRTPPDTNHVWGAQISAVKNLLLSITADFKGGTRLLVRPQTANPFGATESGFYIDNSGTAYSVYNGTARAAVTPKLQNVYNNGASIGDSTILTDSTRRGIQIADYGDAFTPFAVSNSGGTAYYLQVLGTAASANFYGLRVWQHINAWNSNTLFIGDDAANTTGVTLGHAAGGTGQVNTTVAGNLTVNGTTNLSGGFQIGHLILSATGLTADRTFTFPDQTDTVATIGASQTFTGSPSFTGSTFSVTPSGAITLTAGAASTWDSKDGTIKALTFSRSTSGTFTLGDANGTTIAISPSGTNRWNFNGTGFTPAADNTETIGASALRLATVSTLAVSSGLLAASTDAAGSGLTFTAQTAGPTSTSTGKTGGGITATAGAGSAGSAGFIGGNGGSLIVGAGGGGNDAGAGAGGGGSITLNAGAPGSVSTGAGAASGSIIFNVPAPSGAGGYGSFAFRFNGSNYLQLFQSSTLQFTDTTAATAKTINVAATAADTNGNSLSVNAGSGGIASATGGGQGGTGTLGAGNGGASDGTHAAGIGGNAQTKGGTGGAGSGSIIGGSGGTGLTTGGLGGVGTASALSGAGGAAQLTAGNAGASGGAGQGIGGSVTISSGGGATNGTISFQIAGSTKWFLSNSGNYAPQTDLAVNLGGTANRALGVYTALVTAGGSTAAGVDTAGQALSITSQQGGPASATGGGSGGALTIGSSAGGAGTASLNGGASGGVTLTTGSGGAGGTSSVSGGSGALTIGSGAVGANGGGGAGTAGAINFQIGGATQWIINSGGNFTPNGNDTALIGGSSNRVNIVFARNIHSGNVSAAASDTAGASFIVATQQGGASSTTVGGAGGALTLQSNNGGAGDATPHNGGASGAIAISVGTGGASGGAGSTAGAGGSLALTSGTPGAAGAGTGANSGDMTFNIPSPTGAGSYGVYRFSFGGSNHLTYTQSSQTLNFALQSGNKSIGVSTAQVDTAGFALTISAGAGGGASTVGGGNGGDNKLFGGVGGASDGTHAAGVGGSGQTRGANGGAGSGSIAGGTGGFALTNGGAGGVGTATGAAGGGGQAQLIGGSAGTNNGGGGANGGLALIRGGAASGAGTNGAVTIGDANTSAVNIGAAGTPVNLGQGTVTQATSITTGVTVNASSGVITTVSATAAALGTSTFTVTNSCVTAASVIQLSFNYAGTFSTNGFPGVQIGTVSAGSFQVIITNAHATNALAGVMKIHFSAT